ncbi:hypothetical protein HPB52_017238 [Rhipicephalus sanguineus]|uniref:alanine transaminase n=1 Tax=Rhipicephalus sanguineus TaxID=34632 RepID=A0A9D4PY30_RHISA|nr:hypothetical protein HPB52_017238 [Rhipicephalus sanguineus]
MNDKAVSMRGNDVPVTRLGFAPYRVMLSMIREIEDKLKEGKSLGFPYLIRGDISDGQRMGLTPITFLRQVCYYLDEDHGWAHNTDEMQKALDASKSVCVPRCLLLVNPANPPSTVLSMKQLQDIIMFAHKNHLIILADEVFEYNIYDINHPFHSVRKVMNTMSAPYSRTALISFNSLAKGFTVEAGLRSGYFEAINLDSVDQAYLEEAMEADRPSMLSQVRLKAALDCIVRPPGLGDPSYELYTKEKTSTLDSLARRAKMAEKRLNAIPGFHCGPVQGSMAAYARITIPAKAIEEAKTCLPILTYQDWRESLASSDYA